MKQLYSEARSKACTHLLVACSQLPYIQRGNFMLLIFRCHVNIQLESRKNVVGYGSEKMDIKMM